MARIRTVKPEFWRNEGLSEQPEATHMLAVQLLNYADDEGYFNANPMLIKAECSPLREPSVSIPESLQKLSDIHYLVLGTAKDGRRYGRIVAFTEHQRISHPTDSKIKDLEILWEDSDNLPENSVSAPLPLRPEGKGKEQGTGKGKEGRYAFDGRVVKLSPKDHAAWKRNYRSVDLDALLQARDDWLTTQPAETQRRWFISTSNWLANKDAEAAKAKTGPPARRPVSAVMAGTPEYDAMMREAGG